MKFIKLTEQVDRGATGVRCPCGGFAERVKVTEEEDKEFWCFEGCCSRAFVCGLCGNLLTGSAEAPEME